MSSITTAPSKQTVKASRRLTKQLWWSMLSTGFKRSLSDELMMELNKFAEATKLGKTRFVVAWDFSGDDNISDDGTAQGEKAPPPLGEYVSMEVKKAIEYLLEKDSYDRNEDDTASTSEFLEHITDELSDVFGWCHNGWRFGTTQDSGYFASK